MATKSLGLALVVAGISLVAAGCPRESDYTPPIAVSPGVQGRMGLVPRHAGAVAPRASAPGRARAHVMKAGEALLGTNAVGKPGDVMLENDEIVLVFDALGGGVGFAESGGNLVDAADAKVRRDELGQMFTFFGVFPRQAVYDALTFRDEPDGSAVVIAKGKELYEPSLAIETVYRLAPGDRAMLVTTTLSNTSRAPVVVPGLGDAVQWGMAERYAPGKPRGFRGPSEGAFLGGVGVTTSYALTTTDAHVEAVSGSTWSDTFQERDVKLAPGASKSFARVFVVGERGDTASVLAELLRTSGEDVGTLTVRLRGPKGEVPAPLGARVSVRTRDDHELVGIVAAGTSAVVGDVPKGSYLVAYTPSAGRVARGKAVPAVVEKAKATEVWLDVTEPGALAFACTDTDGRNLPCKATLVGANGTETPDLGSPHRAGYARNRVLTETGVGEVQLPPGEYDVVLSRGPEHTIAKARATVKAGETVQVTGTLERVVDTSGYLACDFHQHSMLGADAPVGKRDRVVSNAVEGVEIAATTEHNLVADLSGIVKELSLEAWLVHVPGDEVTTDAQARPFGHMNVFPLVPDPTKPRAGAFPVRGRLASDVVRDARALPHPVVVQVNHPRSGRTGYFDALAFDRTKGEGTGAGYTADFDALEVWNGRDETQRGRATDDYFALLAARRPVTPTANTDTHGVVGEEPGYPRTMVRVDDDTHLDAWDAGRTAGLVRSLTKTRDVVVTNGPFVRVGLDGKGPGQVVRVRPGVPSRVKVRVEAPAWIDLAYVGYRLARGGAGPERELAKLSRPDGRPALQCDAKRCVAELVLAVTVPADDALSVVVRGVRELREVMDGAGDDLRPYAMTSAIFLDADGDGHSLGL